MYSVYEWGPNVAGDLLGIAATPEQAIELAKSVAVDSTAQVTGWEYGYVTTWNMGGSAAKYFPGCDEHGFGGVVPADAAFIADGLA